MFKSDRLRYLLGVSKECRETRPSQRKRGKAKFRSDHTGMSGSSDLVNHCHSSHVRDTKKCTKEIKEDTCNTEKRQDRQTQRKGWGHNGYSHMSPYMETYSWEGHIGMRERKPRILLNSKLGS